ncbi:MAG: hypothetical protein IJ062_11650 [Firmicutes bacterium]|nr:hypothetical protein [Bacillota bacterium]
MSYTSSAVKNRYNKKTYTNFQAALRKEDFALIEEIRKQIGLSRSEFLKMLISEKYGIDFDNK